MKLIRITAFGGPEVLDRAEAPVPTPAAGQILIKVDAAGVNFADVLRRRNDPYPFPTTLPFTPGGEVSGTVEALGSGVPGPPVGTPVFALVGNDGSNGYAQYAVAAAAQVIPIPPGLSHDEAAGIIVAGAAAILALTDVGRLSADQTVLIEGAGGGVGSYAVQIAKIIGATVVGAAGTGPRRAAALAAGADHVIDYTQPDWPDHVRELTDGVDLVLHTSGDPTFAGALGVLAPHGRCVVLGMASHRPLVMDPELVNAFFYTPALNQSLHAFNLGLYFGVRPQVAVAALQSLIGYVATGQVKVPVQHVLPLDKAAEAHRLLEDRASTGKVILKPWA